MHLFDRTIDPFDYFSFLTHKFKSPAQTVTIKFKAYFIYADASGDNCPKSGTYKVVGPNGEDMGKLYMNEGETFPPTQQSGCYYEQV